MAPKKKEVVEETTPESSQEASETQGLSFNVFDNNGAFVRSYTEEIHGKDAKKLAEQFASKINGKVK